MNYLKEQVISEVAAIRIASGESLRMFCKRFNESPPVSIKLNPPTLLRYENGDSTPRGEVYLKLKSMMPIKR